MKLVVLLASAATLITSAAFAADLPSRKVAPSAPVAPAFTWTGFYAGLNAGVDWSSRNVETIATTNGASLLSSSQLAALMPAPYGNSRVGFIGGAQIGYNYQINQFVIGAEADFMGLTASGSSRVSSVATLPVGQSVTMGITGATKVTQDWLGTVRLRAGYAMDRTLIYVTGGLAYGNANVSSQAAANITYLGRSYFTGTWGNSNSTTNAGFAVGAGVEYALTNNWLIRAEYMYYNLGSATVVASGTYNLNGVSMPAPTTLSQKTTIDGNIVRAAISYKF